LIWKLPPADKTHQGSSRWLCSFQDAASNPSTHQDPLVDDPQPVSLKCERKEFSITGTTSMDSPVVYVKSMFPTTKPQILAGASKSRLTLAWRRPQRAMPTPRSRKSGRPVSTTTPQCGHWPFRIESISRPLACGGGGDRRRQVGRPRFREKNPFSGTSKPNSLMGMSAVGPLKRSAAEADPSSGKPAAAASENQSCSITETYHFVRRKRLRK